MVLMPLASVCLVRMCWMSSVGDVESVTATIRCQRPSWRSAVAARLYAVLIWVAILVLLFIPYSVLMTILGSPVDGPRRPINDVVAFGITAVASVLTSTKLFAISQGIVFEGLPGRRAVGRSLALTRGRSYWQSLAIVVVTATVSLATTFGIFRGIPWVLGGPNEPSAVLAAITAVLLTCITSPLIAAILTVLYARQRSREPAVTSPVTSPANDSAHARRPNIEP
jgi:hypothetical protein